MEPEEHKHANFMWRSSHQCKKPKIIVACHDAVRGERQRISFALQLCKDSLKEGGWEQTPKRANSVPEHARLPS
eukprot:1650344-Pleurochrysis_carterae.AAC.4